MGYAMEAFNILRDFRILEGLHNLPFRRWYLNLFYNCFNVTKRWYNPSFDNRIFRLSRFDRTKIPRFLLLLREILELYFREVVVKKRDHYFGMTDLWFNLLQFIYHGEFTFLDKYLQKLFPFIISTRTDFGKMHMTEQQNFIAVVALSRIVLLHNGNNQDYQKILTLSQPLDTLDINIYGKMATQWYFTAKAMDFLFHIQMKRNAEAQVLRGLILNAQKSSNGIDVLYLVRKILPLSRNRPKDHSTGYSAPTNSWIKKDCRK
jgi:hypothetical protein